jgi:hypothetical protein
MRTHTSLSHAHTHVLFDGRQREHERETEELGQNTQLNAYFSVTQSRPTNAYLAFGVSDYTSLSAEALQDLEGRLRIRVAALVMEVSP